LKEWECGSNERIIIQWFYKKYVENKSKWYFIPVGNNLEFEFRMLNFKLCQYFGNKAGLDFTENKPKLDVKDALIMMNGCRFKDYSSIIGKSHKAKEIALWYANKDYEEIEKYIIEEAENFVSAYSIMLSEFDKVRKMLPPIVQEMESPAPLN
jgi:hypothetical protein